MLRLELRALGNKTPASNPDCSVRAPDHHASTENLGYVALELGFSSTIPMSSKWRNLVNVSLHGEKPVMTVVTHGTKQTPCMAQKSTHWGGFGVNVGIWMGWDYVL